ncbi:MAG: type II secretion system F family protein [Candidatus Eisenbacteria bacterium]|nr:type II secretion system F family protein [Candidatus Eisenbacteria bacterium]
MPSYTYRAVGSDGQHVSGVLTAENYQVALRQLDEKALYPITVNEGLSSGKSSFGRGRRVKTSHLTVFYGQLADLLRAGVPMLRSLDVLGKQGTRGPLSQIIRELREDVAGGTSLGDAMTKHPNAFTDLQASMVRAGEQGGFLEDVLHRIAIFCEKQDELKNKVVGAMIYPSILVCAGTGVVLLLMLVVVPKIREFLRPETLNVLSHVVFWMTDFMLERYMLLLVGIGFVVVGLSMVRRTEWFQRGMERVKLRAPLFGKIYTMMAVCRFCRILGTMLHNGVPILQALRISKDSAGNKILGDLIGDAADSVKKGATLSQPLGESGLFPLDIVDMIAVAEESNSMESVLVQIADTNEARTARQIDLAVRVFEPLLLVVMASAVFVILMALLLPMLTMGTGISA